MLSASTPLHWSKSLKLIPGPSWCSMLQRCIAVHQPGIEPGSHRWQRCILPLDHLCPANFSSPSAVCIHHPPLAGTLGLPRWSRAFSSCALCLCEQDTSHRKTSKKTLVGSAGCGPPKLGEIGKAVADAGYSKSMALLLAT